MNLRTKAWGERIRGAAIVTLAIAACRSDSALVPAGDSAPPAGDDSGAIDTSTSTGADEQPPDACVGPVVGAVPLRRMNATQYRNTVRDLFGGVIDPSAAFPATLLGELYTNDLDANPVSQLGVEQLLDAAEGVALAATEHVEALAGCAELDDACARAWLEDVAARAWRRPLLIEERTSLLGLYAVGETPKDGIAATLTAVLQSPSFLYFVDDGVARDDLPAGVLALDDHAIATRLSYLLWDTTPDATLLAAAEAGTLGDAAGIEAETRRMLDDRDRTGPAIGRFYAEWMGLVPLRVADKDPAAFPELDDALAAAIDRELVDFVGGVVLGEAPTLTTLLTTSRTRIDAELVAFFAVAPPADGWIELDPAQRSGLLARPAVAARHAAAAITSPTHRGQLVRTRLLCESIAPPPPGAMQMVPELPPDATARQRSQALVDSASCGGCHALMDPLGFGFEHYDALGRWRDVDVDGSAIDASGEIVGGAGPFADIVELQALLADDPAVQDCLVEHWLRHVYGLGPGEVDPCVLAELRERFAATGGDLHALVVLTTTADAFRLRTEAP